MTKFHPLCCRNLHLSYADSGPLLTTTFKFVVYVALKVTKTIRVVRISWTFGTAFNISICCRSGPLFTTTFASCGSCGCESNEYFRS